MKASEIKLDVNTVKRFSVKTITYDGSVFNNYHVAGYINISNVIDSAVLHHFDSDMIKIKSFEVCELGTIEVMKFDKQYNLIN